MTTPSPRLPGAELPAAPPSLGAHEPKRLPMRGSDGSATGRRPTACPGLRPPSFPSQRRGGRQSGPLGVRVPGPAPGARIYHGRVPLHSETIQVAGVRCERCVMRLAGALEGLEGLESANANLMGQVMLTWDDERLTRDAIVEALTRSGFRPAAPA